MNSNTTTAAIGQQDTFLGHPRGLATLFFTEMWERFSYYGMRAILILFLVNAVAHGGFGLDDQTATAIYGLYTAGVYLAALPGGWIADRLIGGQRAVWYGGIVIMIGHGLLAIANASAIFYVGLVAIVIGTGLLKPNISAIVADLYPEGGARRDAGFTIYYMGINVGALLGPLVVGYLGDRFGWGVGFLSAAIGMALGLVQFHLTRSRLKGAGTLSAQQGNVARNKTDWRIVVAGVVVAVLLLALIYVGVIPFGAIAVRDASAWLIVAFAVIWFGYLLFFAGLEPIESKRIIVLLALFAASVVFWAVYEQAGSSMSLFADRFTDRMISSINFEIPTGWFQSLQALFIVCGGSFMFASLWLALNKRNKDPATPTKLAIGLIIIGAAFLFMVAAAKIVATGEKVTPWWLIITFILHTVGELCLSPIGMSSYTKLVPHRFTGQIMGLWFLSMSLGNLLASRIAGRFDVKNIAEMPSQYMDLVWFGVVPGVILLLLTKPLQKLAGGVN